MTKLIKKNDSRYFSQTSNESYDRHRYKVVFKNGADPVIVDDWVFINSGYSQHGQMAGNVILAFSIK